MYLMQIQDFVVERNNEQFYIAFVLNENTKKKLFNDSNYFRSNTSFAIFSQHSLLLSHPVPPTPCAKQIFILISIWLRGDANENFLPIKNLNFLFSGHLPGISGKKKNN